MTEKQERLLQLLGEFARICRENDLKYVTAEKTALGVMQRGGFLPGDDTVTVYMPAEDWHKLMENIKLKHIFSQGLRREYVLICSPFRNSCQTFWKIL